MIFTENTTLREINDDPRLSQMKGHFMGGGEQLFTGDEANTTLKQLNQQHTTWAVCDMIYGLNNLVRVAETTEQYVFPLDEQNRQVQLIYLPAQNRRTENYMILNAGGAYGMVCTMVEALPVAARLNELGMDCFCLNYTTAKQETFEEGLFPKPLKDMAAALSMIKKKETQFYLKMENYYAGGFSAGGHLAALWGTRHLGAAHYGLPRPLGLMLAYPLIAMRTVPEGAMKQMMMVGMYGKANTQEVSAQYEIDTHIDHDYPMTYIIQCMDDDTVPSENAQLMEKELQDRKISCMLEYFPEGNHGFGLGTVAPGDEWVHRAFDFLEMK